MYKSTGWRDQLVSYNGETFTYDEIGNPTTYRNKTLSWSHARQLDSFGDIASFKYNANGIRISKTVNGITTKYYLNGNKIISQTDGTDTLFFYYGTDGVTGFNHNGTDYFYKKNIQGDIIGIYDSTNTLICKYIYDAWGNHVCRILSNNGEYVDNSDNETYNYISNINPFRYRGYYYDTETGLYYLNSRYYDSELGRFINADSIENIDTENLNGFNLYMYCANNPVNYFDPNGNFLLALTLTFLGLTTIIGAVTSGVKAYKKGYRGWDLAGQIFIGASFGLAAGGAIVSLTAVLLGAFGITSILGVSVLQLFGIGALAFNFSAFIVAPIMGIEMQGIEYEAPTQYPIYNPPKYYDSSSIIHIINIKNIKRKNNLYDKILWKYIRKK